MINVGQEVMIVFSNNFSGCIGKVVKANDQKSYQVDVVDSETHSIHESVMFSDEELIPVKMAIVK